MRFTKVSYAKTFPLQAFSNEKLSVELELEEGESPELAMEAAKKFVHEFHEKSQRAASAQIVSQQPASPPPSHGNVIEQISKCTTIEECNEWDFYVNAKGNETAKAYLETIKKRILRETEN